MEESHILISKLNNKAVVIKTSIVWLTPVILATPEAEISTQTLQDSILNNVGPCGMYLSSQLH
jgi:hypothetical protein